MPKLYRTDIESEADLKVFVTDIRSDADLVIFETGNQWEATEARFWCYTNISSEADMTVHYTDSQWNADLTVYRTDVQSRMQSGQPGEIISSLTRPDRITRKSAGGQMHNCRYAFFGLSCA